MPQNWLRWERGYIDKVVNKGNGNSKCGPVSLFLFGCTTVNYNILWNVCSLTFVSDEVSAKDNEEAKHDEDNDSHHSPNHSMINT